eukprot:gene29128-38576_t
MVGGRNLVADLNNVRRALPRRSGSLSLFWGRVYEFAPVCKPYSGCNLTLCQTLRRHGSMIYDNKPPNLKRIYIDKAAITLVIRERA